MPLCPRLYPNSFPLHQLKDNSSSWLHIRRVISTDPPLAEEENMMAHRDDHYIFLLTKQGSCSMIVDFEKVVIVPNTLYYILPTQIHYRTQHVQGEGWFIAVDPVLINSECRHVFENQLSLQQPCVLQPAAMLQCSELLSILFKKYEEDATSPLHHQMVTSILQSFTTMAALIYDGSPARAYSHSRSGEIVIQFKRLLLENVRSIKSPSAYASLLNITESYMNEALKKNTGFSVSYWIQQEVMIEAKRLLYYTKQNISEIANLLGYEDSSYFSRLFKKVTGQSAIEFRKENHK